MAKDKATFEAERVYRVSFSKVVRIGGMTVRPGQKVEVVGAALEALADAVQSADPV